MNASYGVSAWPNVREVNEKMDRLVGMPLLPIREEAMARVEQISWAVSGRL